MMQLNHHPKCSIHHVSLLHNHFFLNVAHSQFLEPVKTAFHGGFSQPATLAGWYLILLCQPTLARNENEVSIYIDVPSQEGIPPEAFLYQHIAGEDVPLLA